MDWISGKSDEGKKVKAKIGFYIVKIKASVWVEIRVLRFPSFRSEHKVLRLEKNLQVLHY